MAAKNESKAATFPTGRMVGGPSGTPGGGTAASALDRVAPHNLDAEEGLLASCILDGGQEIVAACLDARLEPEAFYKPEHQIIYQALLDLFAEGKTVDEIVLGDRLQSRAASTLPGHKFDHNGHRTLLELVGGPAAIDRLTNRIETAAHAHHWLEIVREKHLLRRLIKSATDIIQSCHTAQDDVDHFLNRVEEQLFKISQDRVSDSAQPLQVSVDKAVNLVNMLLQKKGAPTGVRTGFTDLNRITFGLQKQEMIVLAARPSLGKTSLALNVAEAASLPAGGEGWPARTLIFSLEMGAEQLALRMLCSRSRVAATNIRDGFAKKEDYVSILQAAKELKKADLHVDDSGHLTILELRAKARRMHSKKKLDLVIIDYLQLISGTDGRAPREQQISEISRGVKAMAKELDVPVLVLSQLNRDAEREKRSPRLSDLRESGSIEQDADIVLLLDDQKRRKEKEEGAGGLQDSGERELIVAKNRNGPVGSFSLTFIPEFTRFENHTENKF